MTTPPYYAKRLPDGETADVYAICRLYEVTDPAIFHAIKKLLRAGKGSGGKSKVQDVSEARDSLSRFLQLEGNPAETDNPALGGQIYWRDLAEQLASVWWQVAEVGGNIQHGDLNTATTFSIVLPQHGGYCFHGPTPMDAWTKAKKWLMSPDRKFEVEIPEPAPITPAEEPITPAEEPNVRWTCPHCTHHNAWSWPRHRANDPGPITLICDQCDKGTPCKSKGDGFFTAMP